jgi:hypothetical protein
MTAEPSVCIFCGSSHCEILSKNQPHQLQIGAPHKALDVPSCGLPWGCNGGGYHPLAETVFVYINASRYPLIREACNFVPFYPTSIHKWLTPAPLVLGDSPPSALINDPPRRITERTVSFYTATPHGRKNSCTVRQDLTTIKSVPSVTQSNFFQPDQEERDQPCTSMLSPEMGSFLSRSWILSNASNATKNTTMKGGQNDETEPQIQP